jgi:hypothetical protein
MHTIQNNGRIEKPLHDFRYTTSQLLSVTNSYLSSFLASSMVSAAGGFFTRIKIQI